MTSVDDTIALIAAMLAMLIVIAFVRHGQTTARCDVGEYVEGVRPTGKTRCVRVPATETDCRGARACHPDEEPVYTRELEIYCTGGSVPVVVDERTIGCQRGR